MNKIKNILIVFFSFVIFIVSLVFIVIEGRLLFSLDWTIYDNVFFGFLRYLFRLLIAIVTCAYSILEFINIKKKSELINFILFIYNICLVMVSIIMLFATTNMVGEIALCLCSIIILIKIIFILIINKRKIKEC